MPAAGCTDNCEHLGRRARNSARLPRAGAHAKILASSREPLRIRAK
jgi:hypothetical protein